MSETTRRMSLLLTTLSNLKDILLKNISRVSWSSTLTDVYIYCYIEHQMECPLEGIPFYFECIGSRLRMTWYIIVRVLRQFRYIECVTIHSCASIGTTISQYWLVRGMLSTLTISYLQRTNAIVSWIYRRLGWNTSNGVTIYHILI